MRYAINDEALYYENEDGEWLPQDEVANHPNPDVAPEDFWYFEAESESSPDDIRWVWEWLISTLDQIKRIDPNGWACLTDGSLDDLHLIEQFVAVNESLRALNHETL